MALFVTDLIPVERAKTLKTLIRRIKVRFYLVHTIAPNPNAATGMRRVDVEHSASMRKHTFGTVGTKLTIDDIRRHDVVLLDCLRVFCATFLVSSSNLLYVL